MNQALGCPPRQRSAAWQITQQPAHFDATCGHGDAGNVQRATPMAVRISVFPDPKFNQTS